MLVHAAVILSVLGAALCRPQITTAFGNFSNDPLSEKDREFLRSLPTHRGSYPAGFKETFVAQNGYISHGTKPAWATLKVVGSPGTAQSTVDRVAGEVHKMLRLSPEHIFNNLAARGAGVGIYTAAEKMTIFPEYSRMRDTPQCHNRCDGSCAQTCTFDGRKWETVGGAGGSLAVVLQENVMCYNSDPYHKHDSIAIHEFAHTIDGYGFDASEKQMKETAYNHARSSSLWRLNAYGMANSAEYFAEATGVFFFVNMQSSPGGMNECGGQGHYCTSEMRARYHIYQQDPQLYNLLVHVYTNNRGTEPGGLTVCP